MPGKRRVLLEIPMGETGTFSSEGRWGWEYVRLFSKLDFGVTVIMPDSHPMRAYWVNQFPTVAFLEQPLGAFDVFFLFQPGAGDKKIYLNDAIDAKKRILNIFEPYWYGGTIDEYTNVPSNARFTYAITPYKQELPHNNWPKKHKVTQLPYLPYYYPESSNWANKGILLTIKNPCTTDYTPATQAARLDQFKAALYFRKLGVPVTITMGVRLGLQESWPLNPELLSTVLALKEHGATYINYVPPDEFETLVSNHSIIYPGKVNEVGLYGCCFEGLARGTLPIMYSDWPEQFFRTDIFTPYVDMTTLCKETERLLSDEVYYKSRLAFYRSNIDLFEEAQVITILKDLIDES